MQKLKTKDCGLTLVIPELQYLPNQKPTDTHRPALTRHLAGRVHRRAGGGRTTTFPGPCSSSRAPLSTSTTYGERRHYFSLLPLFHPSFKTVGFHPWFQVLARELAETTRSQFWYLMVLIRAPMPPRWSQSVILRSDHTQEPLEEAVMYSDSQAPSSEFPTSRTR